MSRPEKLFPPLRLGKNRHGFMPTDHEHMIYYEDCGNRKGKAIFHIHGGPGSSCDRNDRRYADPKKYRIILHDQRGCGRSKPSCEIRNNTTEHLVNDIESLFDFLNIEKAVLFGGSWGSTLALVFAITHPERVSGMVLRGIFLGEKNETDAYVNGSLATTPHGRKAWERMMSHVTPDWKHDPMGYYYHQLTSPNAHRRMYFGYEWARYETAILHLEPREESRIEKEIRSCNYIAWALMETHYLSRYCFLEDGYIIRNAEKIPDVPVVIVHGKHDMICPPESAERLHKALPQSRLFLTNAGHSSKDPENLKILISETDFIYDII